MRKNLSILKHSQTVAVTIIVITSFLLIGVRFNATWAGEEGYKPHANARLITALNSHTKENLLKSEATVRRGESMGTKAGEWKKFMINTGDQTVTFYLDEKTEVKILSSNTDVPSVQVIEGRLLMKGQSTMMLRDTRIEANGVTSFTFYSWLDLLDVSQIEGTIDIFEDDVSLPVPSASFRLDTLPPHLPPEVITFDASASSAKDFYAWALNDK